MRAVGLVIASGLHVFGVAPEGFTGASIGSRPQVYVPMTMRWLMEPYFQADENDRLSYWAYLFARLKPGYTVESAQGPLRGLFTQIRGYEMTLPAAISKSSPARWKRWIS